MSGGELAGWGRSGVEGELGEGGTEEREGRGRRGRELGGLPETVVVVVHHLPSAILLSLGMQEAL